MPVKINVNKIIALYQLKTGENISITDVANLTGVSRQTLHHWISGKAKSVHLEALEKFCRAMNCSPDDLLEFDPLLSESQT